jgi:hypothetical protein
MKRVAYPAAVGSYALMARPDAVDASEWSLTSVYSTSLDYDSNRRLVDNGKGSEAAYVTADLSFKRVVEDLQLSFAPRYTWRRYSDSSLGNGDDRGASAGLNWSLERSLLNASASYVDQTTLVSELLQTGIVSSDTHRREADAGMAWTYNQTERRALVAQVNYSDVSYYGKFAAILSGYKYTSGSLGEKFFFNERGSFTVSAYGDRLQSVTEGNSSHEYGVQAELAYAISELTTADVAFGSSRRVLSGASSRGTTSSITLTRSLADGLGAVSASYARSLVPYGLGFLVDQQKYSLSFVRPVSAYVSVTLGFIRVQNNETAALLRLDRRYYDDITAGFDWHLRENWTLGWRIDEARTPLIGVTDQTISEWRTSATLRWAPFPVTHQW